MTVIFINKILLIEFYFILFIDSSARSNLRIPNSEDDDGDPNAADVSSGSTSSVNPRPLPRVSRL